MYRPLSLAAVLLLVGPTLALGQQTPQNGAAVSISTPDAVEWQPGPGSLPAGASFAVIEGDPSQEGTFAMRLRMPDGYTIPPHFHPEIERITVIDGTFLVGMGEEIDPEAFTELEAGSFATIQPGHRHYACTDGEVTIQLNGEGPWQLTYVNPEDDPRGADRP